MNGQTRHNIDLVLRKLETAATLSFPEMKVLAAALKSLTGYVDEIVRLGDQDRRRRRKVSFFADPLFACSDANALFDYRDRAVHGFHSGELLQFFNFARFRLDLIRRARRERGGDGRRRLFSEYAEWLKAALNLQGILAERYEPVARKWAALYLLRYPGRGFTFGDLLSPAREAVIAAINTFDPRRITGNPDALILAHLKWRIKTEVENNYIKKRLKVPEVPIGGPSTEEDPPDLPDNRKDAAMPGWLVELVLQEKGTPLDEAFRRSRIFRHAIERRRKRVDSKLSVRFGVNFVAKATTEESEEVSFETGSPGTEDIPANWRRAWLRLSTQRRLLGATSGAESSAGEESR